MTAIAEDPTDQLLKDTRPDSELSREIAYEIRRDKGSANDLGSVPESAVVLGHGASE